MNLICLIFGHRAYTPAYSFPRCGRCSRFWADGKWHKPLAANNITIGWDAP